MDGSGYAADLGGPAGADIEVLYRRIDIRLQHALIKPFLRVPAPGRGRAIAISSIALKRARSCHIFEFNGVL